MSRAEKLAQDYADKKLQVIDPELWQTGYSRYRKMSINVMDGSDVEEAYQLGYEQAEKDLTLTWEDIQIIWMETERYMKGLRQIEQTDLSKFPSSSKEIFEEVLHRFNEYKSKKNESE